MKFKIKITLNKKGTHFRMGDSEYIIGFSKEYIPSDETINSIIYDEVPKELIEKYELVFDSFATLKEGDLVKLIIVGKDSICGKNEISVERGYTKVISVDETKGILLEGHKNWFDFDGNEITKKRKYIDKITLLTQSEYEFYFENLERFSLIKEIKERLSDFEILDILNKDELLTINDILKNHI